ncbi:HAMP domain-containing sensor histidine kinase [Edaphobacter sp.]|uniref:sensor histidine kinase n=1 Tax=Edaphobacter sp. TaxID=1934404 RepID=UPI002DB6D762|nr:HAMP domain-containing sensor histidine kinase [Edaphobacter sp.]HEU5339732.1 HAMP domain-containing sensor histidine kinase [Edaphobacter sp.]
MRPHSIERRIGAAVVCVQLAMAICVTVFGYLYERHAQFRSFDIALQGRADSLYGAVQDADDAGDNVLLDVKDLHIPRNDVFLVRDTDGKVLGSSANLKDISALSGNGPDGHFMISIDGHRYRGIRFHAVRTIDPATDNVRHTLSILYAAPTGRVWEAIYGALRFFALTNLALLILTAWLVSLLVRRSIQPLGELAHEAGRISAPEWNFAPPASALRIKELRPLASAIEGVVHRLDISFTQQRQFLGDAAHELKTAVAVIKSSLQLLSMKSRTEAEYREGLLRSEADCTRMEELVGRMLALARIEAARPESSADAPPQTTALLDGIRAAAEQLRPIARRHEVSIETSGPSTLTAAIAPDLWQTLSTNVLLNAIQYSAPGSTVTISVRSTDDQILQCIVQDHGQGIPAENLPHVFDRFYRGDPSRSRASGGAGLGLAICKAIAEQAGGSITIESRPGTGTTVTIQLPQAIHRVTIPV